MRGHEIGLLESSLYTLKSVVDGMLKLYILYPQLNEEVDISKVAPMSLDEWSLAITDTIEKMTNRTFLVYIEERNGEREYGDYIVVTAKDTGEVEKKAKGFIEKNGSDGHWNNEWYVWSDDCYSTRIESIEEVKDPAAALLEKAVKLT